MKDIRVLCSRCLADYREAGYTVYIVSFMTELCDKCGRPGVTCEIKRGGDRGKQRKLDTVYKRPKP